jgi:diguanylate cyclase (GGDEF)-like protein/PAS domain S-box-containing protein
MGVPEKMSLAQAIPFMVSAGILLLTGLLWWNLDRERQVENERHVRVATDRIATVVSRDLNQRIQSVQWFVDSWQQRGRMTETEFHTQMSSLMHVYPGFLALEWIDADYRVRWVNPISGNELPLDMNGESDQRRRIALRHARRMKVTTMSSAVKLAQGGTGFVIYFPIYIDGQFSGFLAAMMNVKRWMDELLENDSVDMQQQKVAVSMEIDGTPVYAQREFTDGPSRDANHFYVLDHFFLFKCMPNAAAVRPLGDAIPEVIVVAGFMLSLLIGLVLFMVVRNQQEKNEICSEKIAMKLEAAEREVTQQTMRQQSDMQNILMNIATNYINVSIDALESSIHKALGEMAMFVGADRAYVFRYNLAPGTVSNTNEWCQFGSESQKDELQNIPLERVDQWLKAHLQGLPIKIDVVTEMPEGGVRDLLEQQGIKSVLAVPMMHARELLGYVGFDWVKTKHVFTDRELDLLNLFSEILVNIHLRSEADRQLIASRNRMELALQGTNSGLWDWHIPTGEVVFNARWAEMVGYAITELEPTSTGTWERLCHPDDLRESDKRIESHFQGQSDFYECETRMRHKNGEWIWVLDRGKVVEWDENGKPVRMTGTHLDITELKRAQAQLQHMATHDELTGLPTRRLAQDRGQMAIQRSTRNHNYTAFLFLDLDGFKLINDNYGHEVGDRMLKEVARRLLASVRRSDTVARIGGDEFLMILDACQGQPDAERIAGAAIESVTRPVHFDNYPRMKIGCSVGISMFPNDGDDFERLLQRADFAMYRVKGTGKNHFEFAGTLHVTPIA